MRPVPLLPERKRPLLFAHRGCSSLAPENTMAAFTKARESGAPGIELDIHFCADGKLVVSHDDTFLRVAGDNRQIENLPYAEIRSIDAGSFFAPSFSGEHPPLLDSVLEEFCPALYIDIELKTKKGKNDPLPGLLAEKIRRLGDRVNQALTVSSFNPFALAGFKRLCPHIPVSLIWSRAPEVPFPLRRGFGRFLCQCDYLKPEYAQAGRFFRFPRTFFEKRPVIPWTVDTPDLARQMLRLGCEGIITNRPQDMGFITGQPPREAAS